MDAKLEIDGSVVQVEYFPSSGQQLASLPENFVAKWEQAQDIIRLVAGGFKRGMEALDEALCPDTAEVEFGLKINTEAYWIIGKSAGEANFSVKLSWAIKPKAKGES